MPYKDPEAARAYARRHYQANRELYIARGAAGRKATRERIRALLVEAKSKPCADCGVQYPSYVMQFDHVGEEKNFTIGNAGRGTYTLAKVRAEIALCDVVCANCHAERTHQRATASP